jgi:hypothetical protein
MLIHTNLSVSCKTRFSLHSCGSTVPPLPAVARPISDLISTPAGAHFLKGSPLAARSRSLAALKGKGTGSAFFLIVVPFEAGALSSSPEAARIGSLQGAWSRSAEGRSCSISGRTGRAPSRVRALALRPITMLAKTGPGFGADSYLAPEKRGSHWTLLWREVDSNLRFLVGRPSNRQGETSLVVSKKRADLFGNRRFESTSLRYSKDFYLVYTISYIVAKCTNPQTHPQQFC